MAKRQSAKAVANTATVSEAPPRWLVLTYEPVSLFSLRSTYSMSKGGKTLLLPTPYSVKMALIDAVFRFASLDVAKAMFDRIKARRIRFQPPSECVVQNTFVKIRQEERGADSGQYVSTIAYRELVFFAGTLGIAMEATNWTEEELATVIEAAMHVNYFGKRGSFFQFTGSTLLDELPAGYSIADGQLTGMMPLGLYGVTQYLDDFGPDLCKDKDGFERISTYHDKDIKQGKHRVLVSTLVPYRRVEATRSFTRYTSQRADS
jgi:hypothetical protein